MGVDFVDLEVDTAKRRSLARSSARRRGSSASTTSARGCREKIEEVAEEIKAKCDPDITKIACMANNLADTSKMLAFLAQSPGGDDRHRRWGPLGFITRDSRREVRGTLHLRGLQPGPDVRPRDAPAARASGPITFTTRSIRLDRGLRGDRRPDRPEPQPGRPQRRVPRAVGAQQGPRADPGPGGDASRSPCRRPGMAPDFKGMSVTIPHKEAVVAFLNADRQVGREDRRVQHRPAAGRDNSDRA